MLLQASAARWLKRQVPFSARLGSAKWPGTEKAQGRLLHWLSPPPCFSPSLQQILTIWWLCVVAAVIAVSSTRVARRPAVLHLERRAVWVRSLVGGQLIPQIPRTTLFCISVPNFQSPNTPVLAKMLSSLCLRVRQILTCLPPPKKKNHPQNILWHSCSKRKITTCYN